MNEDYGPTPPEYDDDASYRPERGLVVGLALLLLMLAAVGTVLLLVL